jgi:hypothetical protein
MTPLDSTMNRSRSLLRKVPMKLQYLFASVLVLVAIGCTTIPRDPIRHRDFQDLENPFSTDTITIYLDMHGALGIPKAGLYAWTYIELTKWSTASRTWFTIDVRYEGESWRFLTGEVLVKTAIGVEHLRDAKPSRDVVRGGVVENIRAAITRDTIKAMAESSIVQFQFYGEPVTISEDGLKAIRIFYQRMIVGEQAGQ